MTASQLLRRASPCVALVGLAACDLASFAADPKPIFEQTWNLPATGTSISVSSLLPASVVIYSTPASNPPDSSAFLIDIGTVAITERIGDHCSQCQLLSGTTAPKPPFTLNSAIAQGLPTDVATATVLDGQLTITMTNALSFDPLHVTTGAGPQGLMTIVVSAPSIGGGRVELGRVVVDGDTALFPPGDVMTIPMDIASGTVTGALSVDLTLDSPAGDNTQIDADGQLTASATMDDANGNATLRVGSVGVNIVNKSLSSATGDSIALNDIDEGISEKVVRGSLELTIDNPFDITGSVDVSFGYAPGLAVTKTLSMPTGTDQKRTVTLDQSEIQLLLGNQIGLTISGAVNSTGPITVTPKQNVAIDNRLILTIRTGS